MFGEDETMPVVNILETGAETDSKKMLLLLPIKNIRTSDCRCRSLFLCSMNCGYLSIKKTKTRVIMIPPYRQRRHKGGSAEARVD